MINNKPNIYVIGYGNRNRQDDCLGPELAAMLKKGSISGVTAVEKHQLSIDDAYDIAMFKPDVVIFIDASINGEEPFSIYPVYAHNKINFSIPLFSPEMLLFICSDFFDTDVKGYMVGIRGYEWGFNSEISPGAVKNLDMTFNSLQDIFNIILINTYKFSFSEEADGCKISTDYRYREYRSDG